jgi:hypothetical protein
MNTVGRANVYRKEILDAGVGDYISHEEVPLDELESRDPCPKRE